MTSSQPNILFLLVDDMGWRDLSCQGSTFYETPNIDSLAREGVTFTDAYAACPVCSPTRASLLSGKYPARVGVTNFIAYGGFHPSRGRLIDAPYIDHLPESEHSLAAALHDGGYQTWHVGKWHCGDKPHLPENHGFEVNVGGTRFGSPGYFGGYFAPWTQPPFEDLDVPEGTYLDDYLTDEALRLIRQRDADRPFFLNLWFYLVHTPLQARPDLVDKYVAKAREMGLDSADALVEGDFFPCEHKKDQRIVRRTVQSDPVYAAMVETLDANVGRLLRALRDEGVLDNTLVVFTSDNGGLATSEGSPTCNAPLAEGKGWMQEGGTREPMLVRWPGVVPAGGRCEEVVTSPDMYPTFLEAAGLDLLPDQHVDGLSLMPLLRDPAAKLEREAVYWHFPHYGNQGGTPGCSIRSGDWKLIEFFETGHVELYNLRDDIGEQHDQAGTDPDRARKLQAMLHAWQDDVEARMPEPNPDFRPWQDHPLADPRV